MFSHWPTLSDNKQLLSWMMTQILIIYIWTVVCGYRQMNLNKHFFWNPNFSLVYFIYQLLRCMDENYYKLLMNNDLNIFTHKMNLLYVLSNVNIQDSHVADIGVPIIYKILYLLVFISIGMTKYSWDLRWTQVNTKSYDHIVVKNTILLDIHFATVATSSFNYHVIISVIKALFDDRKSAPLSISKFLLPFR